MTTVSRVSQVSHTNVTGTADWDHRLNRLLEDLQDTVIPSDSKMGNANEYREYRMTQRTQINDEPAQQVDEKWVEVGTTGGGSLSIPPTKDHWSTGGTRFGEKSVAFSDDFKGSSSRFESSSSSSRREGGQMEYLAPANSTTVIRSASSPTGYAADASPKVEKKEFYAKQSYTTLIKGGPELVPQFGTDAPDRFLPPEFRAPALQSSSTTTSSETTKSSYMAEKSGTTSRKVTEETYPPLGQPLHASTPISKNIITEQRDYRRELITDRGGSVTPPPRQAEALKTPPVIRKILQSSQQQQQQQSSSTSSYQQQMSSKSSSTTSTSHRPPVGGVPTPIVPAGRDRIPNYDELSDRNAARYYTSTSTTEHRSEREMSPVRRFPSPYPPPGSTEVEPPKRLDELLATFGDHSYSESYKYSSDGSGTHRSIPYGPGTQHAPPPLRQVRIDDSVQERRIEEDESQLVQRKTGVESRNVAGPPVFYPPGQIFQKTEEDALMAEDKGKGKMKAKREYKEKMKSKHAEKDGGGAVPVPVCLPVCCAAPCVIQ